MVRNDILQKFPDLFGSKTVNGRNVNVEEAMDAKRRMLLAHESQRDWVKRQHGIDNYVEAMESWTRSRGRHLGVAYAEGFRQYTSHPYPRSPLLQELAGRFLLSPDASRK